MKRKEPPHSSKTSIEQDTKLPKHGEDYLEFNQALISPSPNIEEIRELIKNGNIDLNTYTIVLEDSSLSVLHYVAYKGTSEVLKLLEENGVEDKPSKDDSHAIHFAAKGGNIDCIEYLSKKFGAQILNLSNGLNATPLHLAALNGHLDVVNELVKSNANINAAMTNGATPLHEAAQYGHLDVVNELVKSNANINAAMTNGATPLHEAAYNGHLDVVNELVKSNANINAAMTNGDTPLHLAALNGHLDVVNELVKSNANINAAMTNGDTPLHLAAQYGHLDVVNELVKSNANINAATTNGVTPLHLAAQNGHLDVVNELVKSNANINAVMISWDTPLHLAAKYGHLDVVNELVKLNANINAATINGNTPLHLAAKYGRLAVVNELVKLNANINAATINGNTPLHTAAYNGHLDVVKELLKSGAEFEDIASNNPIIKELFEVATFVASITKLAACPNNIAEREFKTFKNIGDLTQKQKQGNLISYQEELEQLKKDLTRLKDYRDFESELFRSFLIKNGMVRKNAAEFIEALKTQYGGKIAPELLDSYRGIVTEGAKAGKEDLQLFIGELMTAHGFKYFTPRLLNYDENKDKERDASGFAWPKKGQSGYVELEFIKENKLSTDPMQWVHSLHKKHSTERCSELMYILIKNPRALTHLEQLNKSILPLELKHDIKGMLSAFNEVQNDPAVRINILEHEQSLLEQKNQDLQKRLEAAETKVDKIMTIFTYLESKGLIPQGLLNDTQNEATSPEFGDIVYDANMTGEAPLELFHADV